MSRAFASLASLPPLRGLLVAWAAIDAAASAERTAHPQSTDDTLPRQLLIAASLFLVLGYSFGDTPFFTARIAPWLAARGCKALLTRYEELLGFSYWAWAKILGYGVLPIVHLKLLDARLGDFGLRGRGESANQPWRRTYLLLFALLLPLLMLMSTQPGFQAVYPFYRQTGRSLFDFAIWEAQYLLTFVAVEFFFRGYLLFGLRKKLGSLAIFVAMVPYSLVHVLKPPAEALGSIVAGVLLGTLALRTGSVWCGVLLHVSVALTMDVLAAWQGHRLPHTLWPQL